MTRQIILMILAALAFSNCTNSTNKPTTVLSSQKNIVETYMDGFRATDHAKILSCLTDDVVWDMPGFFHHEGKEAFNKEIENPDAGGNPDIIITRLIEEGTIVVAEGTVTAKMKNGGLLDAVFCDLFHFTNGKISKLTTYLMFKKQP